MSFAFEKILIHVHTPVITVNIHPIFNKLMHCRHFEIFCIDKSIS
jgi:hypothetical protein